MVILCSFCWQELKSDITLLNIPHCKHCVEEKHRKYLIFLIQNDCLLLPLYLHWCHKITWNVNYWYKEFAKKRKHLKSHYIVGMDNICAHKISAEMQYYTQKWHIIIDNKWQIIDWRHIFLLTIAALLVALRKRNFFSFSFSSPSILHILTFSACSQIQTALHTMVLLTTLYIIHISK